MFEVGMSALVLKICSEYAKALGLNFPPCVQQEINAIAQYVDLHTVKDLKVEQDGSVVTITCYTEGEQEKVFTVTLPEVNVDTLSTLLKGSSTVVVDKSEDGKYLVVRLDKSQEVQIINNNDIPSGTLSAELLAKLNSNLYGNIFRAVGGDYFRFVRRRNNEAWYEMTILPDSGNTISFESIKVNLTTGVYEYYNSYINKQYILTITPDSATKGNLTEEQFNNLQRYKYDSIIVLNKEIYRLADNQNVTGLITYVHTGWDGTARKDKSISITVSTKAWTLVVADSGGGKLYKHDIVLTPNAVNQDIAELDVINVTIYSSSNDKINTVEKCLSAIGNSVVCVGLSASAYDNFAAFGYIQDGYISWIYKNDTVFVKQVTISSDIISNVDDTVTPI